MIFEAICLILMCLFNPPLFYVLYLTFSGGGKFLGVWWGFGPPPRKTYGTSTTAASAPRRKTEEPPSHHEQFSYGPNELNDVQKFILFWLCLLTVFGELVVMKMAPLAVGIRIENPLIFDLSEFSRK